MGSTHLERRQANLTSRSTTRTMEMPAWFLWTLFVSFATSEVLTFASKGLRVAGSTLAPEIHPGGPRKICNRGVSCQGSSTYHYYEDGKRVDDFKTRNLFEGEPRGEHSADNPRAAGDRRQVKVARPSGEVEALIAMKEGITSDPLGVLASWNANDSDPCHWMGVTCSQRSNSVIALDLDNLLLAGTISPLLGTLTFLQHLNLSANFFGGDIPTSLLNCSHLTYLGLRRNNLGGTVPSQVGNLRNLQYLDLGDNVLLAGALPTSLGNCSSLILLHVEYTSLGGEIPSTLGQLAYLESLNLSMTLTSGVVPKSLGNCSALTFLAIGNQYDNYYATTGINLTISGQPPATYISGELPAELGQLIHLREFAILGANIHGVFPSWIANLTALFDLAFDNCPLLTGEIPDFLGSLPLTLLVLSGNNFTGAIPKSISNCSNLWFLSVESNALSGVIPPELGLLRKLGCLCLDYNNLIGTIPASLSNCSRLRLILLGGNPFFSPQTVPAWVTSFVNLTYIGFEEMNLVGEIPATLGQISKLDTLHLFGNNLRGVIPASLGNCTSLIWLELSQNQLIGEIPPGIGNLRHLIDFDVSGNFLTGDIPESIGNWSEAQFFRVSYNLFSGRIPSQLGKLQNLQWASFYSDNFNGHIPLSVGNCTALLELSFGLNQMTGSIPASLGNLTRLQKFEAPGNRLEGQIPVDLMRCTQLSYLDISGNLLVGSIPEGIGHLVSLGTLYLDNNQLSGVLPRSLGIYQGLIIFDVSSNNLSGSIPGDIIANLSPTLTSLNVSRNFLSGSLPEELGLLTYATELNFSCNHFSGSIPSGLGSCQGLESLDLSMNNFSGGIPQALGYLPLLGFVNLSYNRLEGPLPGGGIFNSSNLSAASFLGNPGLCGRILLKDCPMGPSPANVSKCTGFQCHRAGVIGASAAALVVLMTLGLVAYSMLAEKLGLVGCSRGGPPEDTQPDKFFGMGFFLSEQDLLRISAAPENIIAVGERSAVYKEVLPGGKTIAIKIVTSGTNEDDGHPLAQAELHTVMHNLSSIKHRNIIKSLGLMCSKKSTVLFLEYMPNGSLHKQLYEVEECVLSWETRFNIAVGVAEGLSYLHSQAHEAVIHRDLKPGNILLDEDMVPKLADFGISKFVNHPKNEAEEATASRLCGTVGYVPPEYGVSTKISTKGDVYSYGIVLLELLTGKHPLLPENSSNEVRQPSWIHIVDWVLEETGSATWVAILDPRLLAYNNTSASEIAREANESEQMKLFLQVALLCTQTSPDSRPSMTNVLGMLNQIQETGFKGSCRPSYS